MKQLTLMEKIAFIFSILLVFVSCATNPVTGKKQVMFMTESQEVQLGAQYDPQVMATFGEYKNDPMVAFLQARADEMGKISHRPNLKYHVKILDSPVINAFAVPGGYIYFTRGILAQFNNEAELIGVLGHEMGHVTARHSASQQSKQQIGQLLLIGGMIASEKFASYAEYAMQGMQLLFLKFSRDNEREADGLGVAYSSKIGYDAQKMADFFQVLNKMNMSAGNAGVPTFMSTHPDPGDRYNTVKQQAKVWQDSLKLASWKVNGDTYLQMIDGIVYGDDPRQGYVEGNTFYHPGLKFRFSFPSGWKIENQPAQVNMAPSDGKALMVFAPAPQKTLEEAVQSTLKELGLTLKKSNDTTVNGMPAKVVSSVQPPQDPSDQSQPAIQVVSCFIDFNGTLFVFHGLSTETDFKTYSGSFVSTMTNFSKLTDASKLQVKPNKILIKKTQRTGTLTETLTAYGIPQKQMQEIALLNNMELTERIQAGTLIKIIGK